MRRSAPAGLCCATLILAGGLSGCGLADQSETLPVPTSGADLTPQGPTLPGRVVRVVDGDTVRVLVEGQREDISVRLIGIDTPETVAPGRPVECFGPQASEFARQVLGDARVLLEFDPTQGETDRYDRTLAYLWIEAPAGEVSMFNLAALVGGYAREVQYGQPYAWQRQFLEAQDAARSADAGLWGACPR